MKHPDEEPVRDPRDPADATHIVYTRSGGPRVYSRARPGTDQELAYTMVHNKRRAIGDDYDAGQVPAALAADLVEGGVARYVWPSPAKEADKAAPAKETPAAAKSEG